MQVILLSATMPADVLDVTTRFMRNPINILVKKEELTLEGIRQFYIEVGAPLQTPISFVVEQQRVSLNFLPLGGS